MEMDKENTLRLAALLHDIGKFWQGSGEPHDSRYNHLTPEDYGKHGAHAKWSASFVVNYLPEEFQNCESLVSYHHNSKNRDLNLKIIALADWLSSGERRGLEEGEGKGEREKTPLISIFSRIDIGKGRSSSEYSEYRYYYPVKKLELNRDVIFPKPLEDLKRESGPGAEDWLKGAYKCLWNEFVDEVKEIKTIRDFDAYFNTLYHLLQKYTWCVPSAVWRSKPDVPLFDHLKTACAIASCLYKSNVEEEYLDNVMNGLEKRRRGNLSECEEALNEAKFLLIGGDISGIQKFIYAITSKGAAKGLRGRSFYLELLSESIAKYILRELSLPFTNLLYCGGGHFYILAPGVVEADLNAIRKRIAEILLEIHKGELYLVLEWLPLSANDFQNEKFGIKWGEIGDKIALGKKRKFTEILEMPGMHEKIFGPIDRGGTRCEICGSEEGVREEEGRMVCSFCKSLEVLAKDIARANYWIETWKEGIKIREEERGCWKDALSKFGVEYEFKENIEIETLKKEDPEHEHIFVYKLNDTNFTDVISGCTGTDMEVPISFGFKFLVKNTPYNTSGEIKDFGQMADDSAGIKRWAVLRADVDDLGMIFLGGLGEDRTISRISNLSFMLSLFFRGWIERICEGEGYKGKIYAIYSGGDDLFIVGSWDRMPEIGKRIYEDFRVFTCRNPNITSSTGITIAPSKKYPLSQVADTAGEALDKSKSLKKEDSTPIEKDGITFLGMPVKWYEFSGEITNLKANLEKLLKAGGVSRAILQKLYEIYDEYKRESAKHGEALAKYDDRYGRWRWLLAYVIARTKVSKENEPLLRETEKLIRKNIEYLPIAVRWVEFLTRKEQGEKNG